jgi:hypothetical protein
MKTVRDAIIKNEKWAGDIEPSLYHCLTTPPGNDPKPSRAGAGPRERPGDPPLPRAPGCIPDLGGRPRSGPAGPDLGPPAPSHGHDRDNAGPRQPPAGRGSRNQQESRSPAGDGGHPQTSPGAGERRHLPPSRSEHAQPRPLHKTAGHGASHQLDAAAHHDDGSQRTPRRRRTPPSAPPG